MGVVIGCALALFALGATTGVGACASKSCSAVGCVDSVTARIELPRGLGAGGHIAACRKDVCTEVLLPDCTPTSTAVGTPQIYCFKDPPDAASSTDTVSVLYDVEHYAPPIDGEVFTFRVTDAAGAVVAERSGPVTYADFYPNGPSCGGACRRGSLP